jgi:hypothetical protein
MVGVTCFFSKIIGKMLELLYYPRKCWNFFQVNRENAGSPIWNM